MSVSIERIEHILKVCDNSVKLFMSDLSRYDTIRDAVLTCAQKLTKVSLIYRTEPATKSENKQKKTKKQKPDTLSVNSPGNPWSQS